jgi:predicted glycoside hydrolase/deacetylase ChbG (UPF0249 family)
MITNRHPYASSTKLLIIHADDLGMAHSINKATFTAFDEKLVTSASVMVPCPWFREVVEYSKQHEDIDFGIHLTLTSEWKHYRWGPISDRGQVPSLLDGEGYFHRDAAAVVRANPREVEIEIRAQIDKAIRTGFNPTHLDCHMLVLLRNRHLFSILARVALDYNVPFMTTRVLRAAHMTSGPHIETEVCLESLVMATISLGASATCDFYVNALRALQPGLNQLVVHPGYDDAELRAICSGYAEWGATWRQYDTDVLSCVKFRDALADNHIQLTNWRQLRPAQGAL